MNIKKMLLPCAALALGGTGFTNAATSSIPDLNGVWQWGQCTEGNGFDCMLLEEDDELLTTRAKAYRDAIDEVAQPKYDCAPISIPHMWTDPYSHQIEQLEDRVVFTYGKDDVVRTVWLDGHGHVAPVNQFFYFGYSTGHYEDGALLVETTKFSFDPQGLNADFKLASSTQKKVTERYELEGDDLVLEVSTVDTFFLKEPWVYKVKSKRDPEPLALPWGCDVEGSRQILKLLPSAYPQDPIVRIDE
ncbi:MAG: hypothetical protein V4628_05430 [Pseudomonadota bacterium]